MTRSAPGRMHSGVGPAIGWWMAQALAPLLASWQRRGRPLEPAELSAHWRRDLGLHELPHEPRHGGLLDWARHDRW